MAINIEFFERVNVVIDATPSWWRLGRARKYAAVTGYFAAGHPSSNFRWATAVTTGIDRVEVHCALPRGRDFGADVDKMRADLEAMKAEMVPPELEQA